MAHFNDQCALKKVLAGIGMGQRKGLAFPMGSTKMHKRTSRSQLCQPRRSISSLASATLRKILPTVASTNLLLQSVFQGSTATVVAPVVDMKSAWDADPKWVV